MEEKLNFFRDPNFIFDEDAHTYTYYENNKPVQTFTSVTGFVSLFKKEFNSEYWSNRKAKELGITQEAILEQWKQTSETAMTLGTNVHKWIEDFYDGLNPPLPTDPIILERINSFISLHETKLHKFKPVAQEFRVFSRKWGLAGTMDEIFKFKTNGKYYIGDWKTNKSFSTDADKAYQKLKYPFDDLNENSLNAYSIQLSLYQLILEEEAGFKTDGAFIGWIGPNNKPELHKTINLKDKLRNFLEKNKITK